MNLELWDVSGHLGKLQLDKDTVRVYRSQRTIKCIAPPTSLSTANGVIVVGESNGSIQLFDVRAKDECLQMFCDHKSSITDLYVVGELKAYACAKLAFKNVHVSVPDGVKAYCKYHPLAWPQTMQAH
jgi:hypothetical protein